MDYGVCYTGKCLFLHRTRTFCDEVFLCTVCINEQQFHDDDWASPSTNCLRGSVRPYNSIALLLLDQRASAKLGYAFSAAKLLIQNVDSLGEHWLSIRHWIELQDARYAVKSRKTKFIGRIWGFIAVSVKATSDGSSCKDTVQNRKKD